MTWRPHSQFFPEDFSKGKSDEGVSHARLCVNFVCMRFYILPFFLFVAIAATAQDTANKWSLRKAVDYAVQNNLTVKQADIQRMYADIDLKQANLTVLPTLGGTISTGYSFGLSNNPATG